MGGEISNSNYEQELQQAQTEDKKVVLPDEMLQDEEEVKSLNEKEETLKEALIGDLDYILGSSEESLQEIKDRFFELALYNLNQSSFEEAGKYPVETIWNMMEKMKNIPIFQGIYETLARDISGPDDLDGSVIDAIDNVAEKHGYFVNPTIDGNVPFLLKIDGEVKLTENSGIETLFGKEITEIFNSGRKLDILDDNQGGFVNSLGYIGLNSNFINNRSENISPEKMEQVLLNNELTHQILMYEYDFYTQTEYDWGQVDSGISGLQIANSHQVHEFLSDVSSSYVDKKDILRSFGHIDKYFSIEVDDSGEVGFHPEEANSEEGYAYVTSFVFNQILEIMYTRGVDMNQIAQYSSTYEDFQKNITAILTPEDLTQIQQKMLSQGKYLLSIIKDMKKEQTPA